MQVEGPLGEGGAGRGDGQKHKGESGTAGRGPEILTGLWRRIDTSRVTLQSAASNTRYFTITVKTKHSGSLISWKKSAGK